MRVLSELTDVTMRVIFINMDNPDDWKRTNITVFKEKKNRQEREPRELNTGQLHLFPWEYWRSDSYKLFLGMWRTGRQLETAGKGVSRKNLAWPTWLPPTVTASATEGENSGNHLYSARLLMYLHVVPLYLSVGYGLDEWWRVDCTVRLKQSIYCLKFQISGCSQGVFSGVAAGVKLC